MKKKTDVFRQLHVRDMLEPVFYLVDYAQVSAASRKEWREGLLMRPFFFARQLFVWLCVGRLWVICQT